MEYFPKNKIKLPYESITRATYGLHTKDENTATPTLSLGEDTARLNPKLSSSPIAGNTNLVGQSNPTIRREIQRYQIMHIRIQRRFK